MPTILSFQGPVARTDHIIAFQASITKQNWPIQVALILCQQGLQRLRGSVLMLNCTPTHVQSAIQLQSRARHYLHLPIRALGKEDRLIPHRLTTNPLHLSLTASAEKIEAYTIFFWFNHAIEPCPQLGILSFRQLALKDTELHPLPIGLEDLVEPRPAFIIGNIVGDHHMHG